MPVTSWQTVVVDGKDFLEIDMSKLRIPLEWDPNSNVLLLVAAPDGGIFNHPALLQGNDGVTPDIDTNINRTSIAWDDPTPEFASWTKTGPTLYQLNLGVRQGSPGAAGDTILTPSDYGTPVAGQLLRVKTDLSGFELIQPRIGNRYLPATIAAVPTGNPAYTLCAVPVPAQLFDWYPEVEGSCVVTGTGADVRVNLVARLSTAGISNGETAGPIVGQAFGGLGVTPPTHTLSSAPPPGSGPTYDKVLAGNSAVIYLRTERQAGANTYSTNADTTNFKVKVMPIP